MSDSTQISLQAKAARLSVRLFFKPVLGPRVPIAWQRRICELMKYTLLRPRGVQCERVALEGIEAEKLGGGGGSARGPVVVYWHGGGYAIGSPSMVRSITARIAKQSGFPVYAPTYRLAPEHPHPAQLEDGLAFVRALERKGVALSRMIFAGDSAGAHLALSAALRCRDAGYGLPRGLVLISPWVDVLADRKDDEHQDAMLSADWSRQLVEAYLPSAARERYVPLADGDLKGLPPTLVQYASAEMLAPDARLLARRLRDAGVDVWSEEAPGMWHDYHLHAGLVPEATRAVRRAAQFIQAVGAVGADHTHWHDTQECDPARAAL